MPYNQIEWIDVSLDEIENSGFEVSELVAGSGEQDNMTPPELAKADPEVSHDLYQKRW